MHVHTRGAVEDNEIAFPYYVMELYESVVDADKYVASNDILEDDFVQLLERVLEAVSYMHSQNVVHLDIKPGNIMVRPENQPVVGDLGFAKALKGSNGNTVVLGTEGYIHPSVRKFVVNASSDPNRFRSEIPRSDLSPTWDLYSLGQTILRLLEVLDRREDRPLSLYVHRYIKLLACRLLDGENKKEETLLGLSPDTFSDIKYAKAYDALQDIRKLTGGFNLETRVPELNQFGSETIQASTFSTTRFTPRVKALLDHDHVARLAGFTQLSLLNLVYPTATHTRLEHVMGAYSAMCRYLTALNQDPINPLFRQIMTEEDIAAALVVSLIHDIGHYALAHDLEEAEGDFFSHEDRGKVLLRSSASLKAILENERLSTGEVGWGVPAARVLDILEADVPSKTGTVKDRLIHALIDGPIDVDKLDYIIRDSTNLGLTYGSVIDVERLLRVLTIVTREETNGTYVNIGIHEKGRVTAEAVAFARYALYGSVYWHHAYRAVKAMLQRIAWEYLELVVGDSDGRRSRIREKVRKDLSEAFGEYDKKSDGAPQQLPLGRITWSTKLHPGDQAMLEWLAEHSGENGRDLANLIQQRTPFKRVLVVSRWGGKERLWRSITNVFSPNTSWTDRLEFQREFQNQLASAIEQVDKVSARTSLVVPDEKNTFLAAIRSRRILVLVDATQPRPGASSPLGFVREEDRRRARIDEAPMTTPEESNLWKSLRTDLHESLGKVRVFCHPDHARFVSALDRDLVEDVLAQAARTHSVT